MGHSEDNLKFFQESFKPETENKLNRFDGSVQR